MQPHAGNAAAAASMALHPSDLKSMCFYLTNIDLYKFKRGTGRNAEYH